MSLKKKTTQVSSDSDEDSRKVPEKSATPVKRHLKLSSFAQVSKTPAKQNGSILDMLRGTPQGKLKEPKRISISEMSEVSQNSNPPIINLGG